MRVEDVTRSVREHHKWFSESLPLIASENVTSPAVRRLLATDFAHRYAEGTVGHRYYQGVKYIDEVEQDAIDLALKLFQAEHVNVQPISGVNANIEHFLPFRTQMMYSWRLILRTVATSAMERSRLRVFVISSL